MTPKERKEHRRLRLIELIAAHFNQNQAAFAEAAQIAANLVSRYVNGTKGIGEDMRDKIEKNTGFLGWLDQISGDENTEPGPEIAGTVPLISWVAAGDWSEAIDSLSPGDGERIPAKLTP